jgi:hypothetical protein
MDLRIPPVAQSVAKKTSGFLLVSSSSLDNAYVELNSGSHFLGKFDAMDDSAIGRNNVVVTAVDIASTSLGVVTQISLENTIEGL